MNEMLQEAIKMSADAKRRERITTLAAAMLTGTTAPGEALINQVLLISGVIADKIEAGVL